MRRSLLFALPLSLVACGQEAPAPAPTPPPPAPAAVKRAASTSTSTTTKTSTSTSTSRKRAPSNLNVILLTVDALRADMPWQGYSRPIAPNLTKLAEKSAVFTRHRATSSFTAQSVPALLAGRPASTLYRSGYFFAGYQGSNELFPELLQAAGVRTMAVQSHLYFNRGKGIEQGFDVWQMVPGITFNERTDEHVTSDKTNALLIENLSKPENVKGQFFAWTHYTDPHAEYKKHPTSPDFGDSDRDRYDNEVHHTDKHIGDLLAFAEKQPWWGRTAVIVSADHGEAFGEHGMLQHAHELYEELVRVPLIVHVPGLEPRRIDTPHTHLDLAPTIMALMGHAAPSGSLGESLVPELEGKPGKKKPILLELAADNVQPARRAVVSGDFKLIRFGDRSGPEKLFDLANDPGEKRDLAKSEPDKLAELRALLDESFAKLPIVAPHGGMKLKGGGQANGPMGPVLAAR